ncbi:hypothetical protein, partial [Acrocarpospora macrocephala]
IPTTDPGPPPPPPPTSTAPPPDTPGQKTSKAWNLASKAVQKDKCKRFLATAGITVEQVADVFHKSSVKLEPGSTIAGKPDAVASVPDTSLGTGAGPITLWQPFFNDTHLQEYMNSIRNSSALTVYANAIRNWSVDQMRALKVLHEVAHLTGKLPANHEGPWGSNPDSQSRFEQELVFNCPIPAS